MNNKEQFIAIVRFAFICLATYLQAKTGESLDSNQNFMVSGGVNINANLSYYMHRTIPNGKSIPDLGGALGGFVNFDLSKGFSLQVELLFNYDRSSFTWFNNDKGNLSTVNEEIAVYAMYHWQFRKREYIHLGIGPYTAFGFYASLDHNGERSNLYDRDSETDLPIFMDVYSGFSVMVGYEYHGWQVNASYKMSYLNLLDENSSSAKLYPQTFSLGIAYCFRR